MAEMMAPSESNKYTYGPYSSLTQNVPSSLITRPSASIEMCVETVPFSSLSPKPSPNHVAAGSKG